MATPHNQMRRLMAEDFALHLGTAAGNRGADFDEAARADTPADDRCEPTIYADLELINVKRRWELSKPLAPLVTRRPAQLAAEGRLLPSARATVIFGNMRRVSLRRTGPPGG